MDFRIKMTYGTIVKAAFQVLFLMVSMHVFPQKKIHDARDVAMVEKGLNAMPPDTSKVSLLLELSQWYRALQPKSEVSVDYAIKYVNNALEISQKLSFQKGMGSSYLLYSNIEQDRQNFKKTIYFAQKAANCFQSVKEYDLLGEAQVMQWSGATLLQNPFEERAAALNAACVSFGKAKNPSRQGDCMKELGDLYQYNRKFEEALPILKRALAYYTAAGRKDLLGVYDLLGSVNSNLGDYEEGIKYGLLAMRNAEQLGEKGMMLCTIFNRLGSSYFYVHDYSKAMWYFDKAEAIARRNRDIGSINLIYAEKCIVWTLKGKYREIKGYLDEILKKYPEVVKIEPMTPPYYYMISSYGLGQKKQAAYYFNVLDKIMNQHMMVMPEKKSNICEGVISYLIDTRDFKKAAYYTKMYHELIDQYGLGRSPDVYYFQFKMDSVAGNYLSAIKNLQQFKKFNDKISNDETMRQINQLNALYETQKKDRNISKLTKTTAQQQQNLQRAQKIRNITFIVLALVFIILLLSVLGYYQKKKTNKLLQKKQQAINDANESLQHLVVEKEWLLREIHHRVKNNLHMVAGLLASQTEFIKGEEALQAITDSQHRVQAMSIIHQKLYQTETLSHINMATYINELTEYLDGSFSGNCPVKFRLDIDSVDFPLSHSIPVGLIINEAVTNSIKYAFDVCGDCFINIVLKNTNPNEYLLLIKDNGVGMPDNFNISESNTLGMRLIEGLSKDMHADLKMYNENGSVIELRFTLSEDPAKRIAS